MVLLLVRLRSDFRPASTAAGGPFLCRGACVTERITELRVELPAEEVAVLDGYCQATGKSRAVVVRKLLKDWSDKKRHEAILICRVSGGNPGAPESVRSVIREAGK